MNIEEAREYCLSLKNVTESFPFDEVSLVFKVENKMFAVLPLDVADHYISLKCDPEQAEVLRDMYGAVEPAYHFNKKHWNSVYFERDMPDDEIVRWIRHSYDAVIAKLPKMVREMYADE